MVDFLKENLCKFESQDYQDFFIKLHSVIKNLSLKEKYNLLLILSEKDEKEITSMIKNIKKLIKTKITIAFHNFF